jgi:nucleotide-binding universal stress UspA family protein
MLPIRTILHPTDFSDLSRPAFQFTLALARDYRAKVVLLHVRRVPIDVYGEFGAVPPPLDSMEDLEQKLRELVPETAGVTIDCLVREGYPANEILETALEIGASMIVMGTHGRTGLGRLFMGSVAEEVLRKATCPVLAVKAPFPTPAEVEALREEEVIPVS